MKIDFEWIIENGLICIGGFWLIWFMYDHTKDSLLQKYGSYGYRLFKKTISFRQAYFESFFKIIHLPLVISMFVTFIGYRAGAGFWEMSILMLSLSLPPAMYSVNVTLKEMEKQAKKDYED